MGLPQPVQRMSFEEFAEWALSSEGQQGKYEYHRGEIFDVYAMAGARAAHNEIALNVAASLHAQLKGKPCRAFVADMLLRVDADDKGYYPDVMVTCSEADRARQTFKTDAVLVIEVLSPSTAAYDRGEKFASYRRLPTLQEFIFLDPATRGVDHYRRDGDRWLLLPPVDALELPSIGCALALADVFADLESDDIASTGNLF